MVGYGNKEYEKKKNAFLLCETPTDRSDIYIHRRRVELNKWDEALIVNPPVRPRTGVPTR